MDWLNRTGYDADRYYERKLELISFLGYSCAECGRETDLEFDHIDPETKEFSVMQRWSATLDELLPEIRKCQLLCTDCHLKKSAKDSSVPHGGGRSGRRNCPCDLCKARKREYMREYKSKKKLAA